MRNEDNISVVVLLDGVKPPATGYGRIVEDAGLLYHFLDEQDANTPIDYSKYSEDGYLLKLTMSDHMLNAWGEKCYLSTSTDVVKHSEIVELSTMNVVSPNISGDLSDVISEMISYINQKSWRLLS